MLDIKRTTPPVIELIGKHITINKKLGEGACGEVFLASTKTGFDCAIRAGEMQIRFPVKFVVKVMNAQMYSPHLIKHVYNEILSLQQLNHECVVGYLASWIEKGKSKFRHSYCLAMNYCNGGDLHNLIADHIHRKQFVAEYFVLHVMRDVFSALQFMHEKKIIHRDIKPANVLLSFNKSNSVIERALIGDYGLSRPIEDSRELVKSRVGTLFYCSPQIVRGTPYSTKTDIFSAGVMFFEMMCLRRPFGELHDQHQMIFHDIIHKDPEPLLNQTTKGRYNRVLLHIVTACLAKDESCRPSALEVLSLLYNQSSVATARCSLTRQASAPSRPMISPPTPPPPISPHKKEEKNAELQYNGQRNDMRTKQQYNEHEKLEIRPLNNTNHSKNPNWTDCNNSNKYEARNNNLKKVNESISANDNTKPLEKKTTHFLDQQTTPQVSLRESTERAVAAIHNDDAVNENGSKPSENNRNNSNNINKTVNNNNNNTCKMNMSNNKYCTFATNERNAKIAPMRPSLQNRTRFHCEQSAATKRSIVTHESIQRNYKNACESAECAEQQVTPTPELLYCEQKYGQKPPCNFQSTSSSSSSSVIEDVFSILYAENDSNVFDQTLLGLVDKDKAKYIILKVIAAAYAEDPEQLISKINCVNALFEIRNDAAKEIVRLVQKTSCNG